MRYISLQLTCFTAWRHYCKPRVAFRGQSNFTVLKLKCITLWHIKHLMTAFSSHILPQPVRPPLVFDGRYIPVQQLFFLPKSLDWGAALHLPVRPWVTTLYI